MSQRPQKSKTRGMDCEPAGMAAFGRLGSAEDFANAVALLVREVAFWISGQDIRAKRVLRLDRAVWLLQIEA